MVNEMSKDEGEDRGTKDNAETGPAARRELFIEYGRV